MGNIKLTIAMMLKFILSLLCLYGYSLHAVAKSSIAEVPSQSTRHEVTLFRDKDYKCTQCHKESKDSLFGSHGDNARQELGRDINCTDCHGTIGPNHREGAPQVNKFSSAQSKLGTGKTVLEPKAILKANSECMDCHTPSQLQKSSWTHDVHAKNLTCSNCHDIHASQAKILKLDRKERIKLCVDCHLDITTLKEEK